MEVRDIRKKSNGRESPSVEVQEVREKQRTENHC